MAKNKRGKSGKSSSKKKARAKKKSSGFWNDKRVLWAALGTIALATFIAMSPVLSAEWVDIDDKKLILDKGRAFARHAEFALTQRLNFNTPHWKPVTVFTWYLEYHLVGQEPFLYHLNNLLLHILNSILIFFLARKVSSRFDRLKKHGLAIGFFSGLLFGLHPMHVESVAWAVERKDVLFTFFYLSSLLTYIRYIERKSIPYLAFSALLYALSVFSKSPGITVFAMLFLIDWLWQRKLSRGLITEKILHFGVFAFALYALGVFRSGKAEGSLGSLSNDKVLAKAENVNKTPRLYGKFMLGTMRGWLWYVHSFFPVRLSLGYPREQLLSWFGPFIHAFPILFLGAVGSLTYFANKQRLLFFAHAFFFIAILLPFLRMGLGIGIFMSDRYVYLPVFGVILMIVAGVLSLGSQDRVGIKGRYMILASIALLYAMGSFNMSKVWKNTETLWTNTIEKYPTVAYSHTNRGSYYRDQGRMEEALVDLNNSIRLEDNVNARIQRGLVYRQSGRANEAIADYNKALEDEPNNKQALVNRGNALLDAKRFREAIADYDRVIGDGKNLRAGVNRAIAYASLGDYQSAVASFAAVEKQANFQNYADFYMNRGILYTEMRQYENALQNYLRYLQIKPDDHQIMNDVGVVYAMKGDHSTAVQYYTQAINRYADPRYLRGRANSYDRLGKTAEAQQDRARAGQ